MGDYHGDVRLRFIVKVSRGVVPSTYTYDDALESQTLDLSKKKKERDI